MVAACCKTSLACIKLGLCAELGLCTVQGIGLLLGALVMNPKTAQAMASVVMVRVCVSSAVPSEWLAAASFVMLHGLPLHQLLSQLNCSAPCFVPPPSAVAADSARLLYRRLAARLLIPAQLLAGS